MAPFPFQLRKCLKASPMSEIGGQIQLDSVYQSKVKASIPWVPGQNNLELPQNLFILE